MVIRTLFVIFFITIVSRTANAQFYPSIQIGTNFFYFEKQPCARAEAMGRTFTTVIGRPEGMFYNPAGIRSNDNQRLSISYTDGDPNTSSQNNDYNYFGIIYRHKRLLSFGFSRFRYRIKDCLPLYDQHHPDDPKNDYTPQLYTLSAAIEAVPGWLFGININYLTEKWWYSHRDNQYQDPVYSSERYWGVYGDIGMIKSIEFDRLGCRHNIDFAASWRNFLQNEYQEAMTVRVVDINVSPVTSRSVKVDYIPTFLHFGFSYTSGLNKTTSFMSLKTLQWTLALEYRDLLKSKYRHGFHTGGEITLFEILSLMCGYYRERIYYKDADNPSDIKEFLSDFTYGLGINAPLIRLSKGKIPIEVGFDFIKNENPSKYDPDISTPHDFFVWTMTVRWKID